MGFITKRTVLSNVIVDSDLDMGAYDLKTDDILESTATAGVTVDGLLLKDGNIEIAGGIIKYTSAILKNTDASTIGVRNAGDTAYGHLYVDGFTSEGGVTTNIIYERTAAAGITVDSLFIKDGNAVAAGLKECSVTNDTPGTPVEGDMKWDSTAHKLQVYSGTAWETVTSA